MGSFMSVATIEIVIFSNMSTLGGSLLRHSNVLRIIEDLL